jgi:hypothetical protein
MKLKSRAIVFLSGVAVTFLGLAKYQQHGAFPYLNWQKQPVFPMGVVAAGMLVCALSCLPQKWFRRWAGTRPERNSHVLKYLDGAKPTHSSRES